MRIAAQRQKIGSMGLGFFGVVGCLALGHGREARHFQTDQFVIADPRSGGLFGGGSQGKARQGDEQG